MKLNREDIMTWMKQDPKRTIYLASVHFDVEPQYIHDVLNGKIDGDNN